MAVYHFDGRALSPEFRPLPPGEAVTELIGLLLQGPSESRLQTAIPAGTGSPSQIEAGEGVVIEMDESFWSGPPEEVRRRAAQVVFTMAAIEEGKRVTLLDGLVPGDVTGVDGGVLRQPLEREDLADLRPWIQVIQPVAGAIVGPRVPVRVLTRGHRPLLASVTGGSGNIIPAIRLGPEGGTVGAIPPDTSEDLTINLATRIAGGLRRAEVPVRFDP